MQENSDIDIDEELCQRLVAVIQRITPGYASILSTLVRVRLGLDICKAIFLRPGDLFSLLKHVYGEITAKRVLRVIITEALLKATNREGDAELADKLFNALINGQSEIVAKLMGLPRQPKPLHQLIPEIERLLPCLVKIEEAVALLYRDLAEKYTGVQKLLLLYIARESENHAETLQDILTLIGTGRDDCRENTILETIEDLRAKARTKERAKEVLSIMARLEQTVSEKEYMEIVIRALTEVLASTDIKLLQELFKAIASDEKHHSQLAKIVLEYTE
jgi:rubrerythrin